MVRTNSLLGRGADTRGDELENTYFAAVAIVIKLANRVRDSFAVETAIDSVVCNDIKVRVEFRVF